MTAKLKPGSEVTAIWKMRLDDLRKYCDEQESFRAPPPQIRFEIREDGLGPVRGILYGMLFSVPFWVVLILVWEKLK